MSEETGLERLTKKNFHYFLSKVKDLCGEAALENIYFVGVVAYYDHVNQTTSWICRSSGDKCSLAHIMTEAAGEIAASTEEEE